MRALAGARIVPLVVIDDEDAAVDLAATLEASGIACVEVALRTPSAMAAIARISAALPEFAVGAGTVLSADQVSAAADAGAGFIVSPGLDVPVVERALELGLDVLPGVATPSEVQRAVGLGLRELKFFPAHVMGGPAGVRALAGPFPQVRFMPSGGVDGSNASMYLDLPAVFAVSGSWVAPRELIAAHHWSGIGELCTAAVAGIRS